MSFKLYNTAESSVVETTITMVDLRRRGLSLVVHGQTIGLSISDAAEIHFEELQLGKTINHTEEFCVD